MDFDKTQQEYSIIEEGVGPSFDSNDVYVCVVDDMKGLPGDSASVVALRPFLCENPHEKDDEERNGSWILKVTYDENRIQNSGLRLGRRHMAPCTQMDP